MAGSGYYKNLWLCKVLRRGDGVCSTIDGTFITTTFLQKRKQRIKVPMAGEEYWEMLSIVNGPTAAYVNSKQIWLPAYDLYKIKSVETSNMDGGKTELHPSQWNY